MQSLGQSTGNNLNVLSPLTIIKYKNIYKTNQMTWSEPEKWIITVYKETVVYIVENSPNPPEVFCQLKRGYPLKHIFMDIYKITILSQNHGYGHKLRQ